MREIKYIIVKDKIKGNLLHFKSNWLHHQTIARDKGYSERDIIEAGIFIDNTLYILESQSQSHILKHKKQYIGNALNFYQDLRLASWLRARELESQVYYKSKTILREGD